MKNAPTNRLNIVMIADVDLSRFSGDTGRIMRGSTSTKIERS